MRSLHPSRGFGYHRRAILLTIFGTILVGCQHAGYRVATDAAGPEPVNFGYGLDESSFVTSSVSTTGGEDDQGRRVGHVAELLEGRVAGVQVQRTVSGGYSIRIRGMSSYLGDTEPLWVVDGIAVGDAGGQGVSWINPADVARISVLKDAASTSMYGVRGANGVILVTTKRGTYRR